MSTTLVTVVYLVASILFILSLGGLSAQESARRGNLFGMAGMAIAVLTTAAMARSPISAQMRWAIRWNS